MPNFFRLLLLVGRETGRRERGNCFQTAGPNTPPKPRHGDGRLPGSTTLPHVNQSTRSWNKTTPLPVLCGVSGDGAALSGHSTLASEHISTMSQRFHRRAWWDRVCVCVCESMVGWVRAQDQLFLHLCK